MSKSRFRRAGLPAAIAVVAATAAVATTVWLGGNADAGTSSSDESAIKAAASLKGKAAGVASAARKSLKARGLKTALASDSLNFGDITGDGRSDLAAVDKSGTLWIYPGVGYIYPGTGARSKRIFSARFSVGKGWGVFTTLVRHGDFNNDGKTDVLARNAAGALFFYQGTGTTPAIFKKGVQVGRSWQTFKSIVGVGDLNSDGKDDLIAQKTNGDLLLYRGTGNGLSPFAASQTKIGSSFKGSLLTSLGDVTGDGRTELYYRDAAGYMWLYPSRDGASPIDAAHRIGDDSDPNNDASGVKNIVGPGNVYSDAGLELAPDILVQGGNALVVGASDTDENANPDDFVLGLGWNPYYLF